MLGVPTHLGAVARRTSGEKRAGGGVESTERAGPLGDESGRAPLFDERAEVGRRRGKLRAVVPLEIGVSPRRVEARPPGPRPVSYTVTSQPPERGEMRRSAGDAAADDGDARARGSGEGGGHRNRAAAVSGRAGPGRARWDEARVARRIPGRVGVVERGRARAPEVTPAKTRRVASITRTCARAL